MIINIVLIGPKKERFLNILNSNRPTDLEYELNPSIAIDEESIPSGDRSLHQENLGDDNYLYFYFDEDVEDEKNQLSTFAESYCSFIKPKLSSNEEARVTIGDVAQTFEKGYEQFKPNVVAVVSGWKEYCHGNTLFNRFKYQKLAKAEFVVGATAGVLSIMLGFISPAAAGIVALLAIALIAAAVYHQSRANHLDQEYKDHHQPNLSN